jgi:putative flippase GtrA
MLGSTANYLLSVRWVFIPGKFRREIEFSFFMITSLVGLVLNQLTMWFFVNVPRVNYLYAKAFAIVFVTVWNFTTKKRLVFFA